MNLVNEAALLAAAAASASSHVRVRGFERQDHDGRGAAHDGHDEQEKMLTAYHEGGHAIVALNVTATDPVHKATIIPRGRALGMVMQLPNATSSR